MNCLLLAEELRKEVATSVKIGKIQLDEDENWPPLDFGWTLAEVLNNCLDKQQSNTELSNLKASNLPLESSKPKAIKNDKSMNQNKLTNKANKQANDDKKSKNQILNSNEPLGDFVIDVFDPTKYEIKDNIEEEDSDDPEMEEDFYQNFMPKNKNFNLDNAFDLSSEIPPNEQLFNGEFSFSMNEPIDIENDDQSNWTENNKFLNCGMGGLMSISGLENFNMHSLSKDIAKINEVNGVNLIDNFDSDENLSSALDEFEDEEDAEFDPTFKPKNSFFSKPSFVQDEYLFEIQTNGLMIDNKVASDSTLSELTNICNNLKEDELTEDTIVQDLSLNHFEIRSFKNTEQNDADNIEDKKSQKNKVKLYEITKLLKDLIGYDELIDKTTNNKTKQSKIIEKKINKEQVDKDENFQPGFGELLPIKKSNKTNSDEKSNIVENSKEPSFEVKFDPYKKGETDCLGPDPSMILQALTMSNASDGINLERLETVGDSFLKYAVTAYLYCTYDKIHEGKLSHLRSKQISNFNLFRLGKNKSLGKMMVATKFEPSDNWLPPGFVIPIHLEQVLVDLSSQNSANVYDLNALKHLSLDNISENDLRQEIEKRKAKCIISSAIKDAGSDDENGERGYENALAQIVPKKNSKTRVTDFNSLKDATHIPYNLLTQHSIPDKSIADCVESLIGAYLISCGTKSALLFMKWLGLKVMPDNIDDLNQNLNDSRWHWLNKVNSICI